MQSIRNESEMISGMENVEDEQRPNLLSGVCCFEAPEEVQTKIQKCGNVLNLINNQALSHLAYIDLRKRPYRYVKRFMDIVLSALALTLLALPMVAITIAIRIDSPGKAFFSQKRVGMCGRRFTLYKFRSMLTDTPKYMSTQEVVDPDRYITRLGRFLRKTSLDEIPQFWNVLKGDMSLVGPRPLIADEYEVHQMRYLLGVMNVKPGITGFAQVHGRDLVVPAEKVCMDVEYLKEYGLWGDLRILAMTLPNVLKASGIVEGARRGAKRQGNM